MSGAAIDIRLDAPLGADDVAALLRLVWPGGRERDYRPVLARSLVHVSAWADGRLVGFANVATDGGSHASLFDVAVHPDFRRRGVATAMIGRAVAAARERRAEFLHVDFEPHLEALYRACGFRPTAAGLIRPDQERAGAHAEV